jgi:amidohydrolase
MRKPPLRRDAGQVGGGTQTIGWAVRDSRNSRRGSDEARPDTDHSRPFGARTSEARDAYHPVVPTDLTDSLDSLIADATDSMVDIRRDLHRHPELGFEEHRTTALVRDELTSLGLAERPCPTPTGAVFELAGGHEGATVVLRADLDGLPVHEDPGPDVTSEIDGCMHACGHDAHVAALLGVARVLASRRDELAGRHVFVFQPAEESLGGGRAMVQGGVLDGLDAAAVVGCHVTSMAPVGLVAMRSGVTMSEVHSFSVHASGAGGHGATAGSVGNVLLAVAQLAGTLGGVVEGMSLDGTACACSAGVLDAGTAANVVPSSGSLRGTLRTFTDAQTNDALEALRRLCQTTGEQFGCSLELHLDVHAPAVVNDAAVTAAVDRVARAALGDASVVNNIPPVTPSDDVAEFLLVAPGCYFFVGAARPDGTSGPHHSPSFALDERCLAVAARVLAGAAVSLSER